MRTSHASTVVDRDGIAATERLIRPYIRRTPVLEVAGEDLGLDVARLTLKLELTQRAGSFKARGAFANLLLRDVPPAGVVAASGGNHGAAVAFAARALDVPAHVFVPTHSSPAKVARIRAYGADLVVGGERYDDALAASERQALASGALQVHAYDQVETMLGAGSLGLELSEQAPDVDTVLVAVGGGGLIAGVSSWYAGGARIVGVEPVLAPTLTRALEAGGPVDAEGGGIAADALAPRRVGEHVFPIVRAHVDGVVLVAEDDIRRAQALLWDAVRVVAEPAACVPLAALRAGAYAPAPDERVAIVVSGGNTTAVDFER